MPSFSFEPQFAPLILTGEKRQTIRASRRCDPGATMHLFTGLRTKACIKIAIRPCIVVDRVEMGPNGIKFGDPSLHPDEDTFARLDGFEDYAEMHRWFVSRYESAWVSGFVHRWADRPVEVAA